MSKLIIRKRVSLAFLGEECAKAYIDFRSLPVGEYDQLLQKIKTAGDDDKKANSTILGILKDYYLGGKYPNEEGALEELEGKDELDGLDLNAVLICFGELTGQDIKGSMDEKKRMTAAGAPDEQVESIGVDVSPKSEPPSKSGSTADTPHQ